MSRASSRAGAASGRGSGGPAERHREGLLQALITIDLALDVADEAPQPGAQELDPPVHALELFGVGVAPGHHRRPLGDAGVDWRSGTSCFFANLPK